jgi:hypothetical protein
MTWDGSMLWIVQQELFRIHSYDPQVLRGISTPLPVVTKPVEKPAAAVDESRRREVEQELRRKERREIIAQAGGRLLGAAFQFVGELLGGSAAPAEAQQQAVQFRELLADCLQRREDGSFELTVSLPDKSIVDNLAGVLSRLMPGALDGSPAPPIDPLPGPPVSVRSGRGRP